MGILSTGGPGSAVIFYPLTAWCIAALGWRTALVAFGAMIATATLSLAVLYHEPEPRPPEPDITRARAPASAEAWTLRRSLRSSRLWAAFIMTGLGVIGFQIMATHQVAHAVDQGFAPTTVVWLFALGAGCTMTGNLLGGWLSDQVGRGWVFLLGSTVAVIGIGCLALTTGPRDLPLLMLYVASGLGFGMRIAQLSAIPADVFSGPQLGAILGVVQAGGGLGGAVGPFLGGWLFDLTGSYRLTFMAAAVAVTGSAVAAWFAAQPVPSGGARGCARSAPR
jgi:predicted MFS family arabinose efflux permease